MESAYCVKTRLHDEATIDLCSHADRRPAELGYEVTVIKEATAGFCDEYMRTEQPAGTVTPMAGWE